MSTARAYHYEHDDEADGVILSSEDEAALVERLAEADESEKAAELVPWETLKAERGM